MKVKTYKQAINYLESFIGKVFYKVEPRFLKQHDPLERMRVFLSLLNNPQDKLKSVLVGGTSGKGSTSYLISNMLTTAGYKTGFTLSPHLQKINERLQINGKEISDKKFTEVVNLIIPAVEKMKEMKIGAPSYFEMIVGMAFLYFANEKVDIVVAEIGMGGEFDAANTLNPLVAVLTNVSLDHTQFLGNTVEKIAKAKAGIIKTRGPAAMPLVVISGVTQPSVIKILEDRCKNVGAQMNLLWRDFGYKIKKENAKKTDFDFISHEETFDDLELSLLGQYQVGNASLAIKTILELKKIGFKISDEAIRKALKKAFFSGRFEIIKSSATPLVILDGAHNPTKMKEFLKSLKKIFPDEKKVFIVGFKLGKDMREMLKEISSMADSIILTQFSAKTDGALHASEKTSNIKQKISKKYVGRVIVEKDPKKALKIASKMKVEMIVVTGSLYLVGEMRSKIAPF